MAFLIYQTSLRRTTVISKLRNILENVIAVPERIKKFVNNIYHQKNQQSTLITQFEHIAWWNIGILGKMVPYTSFFIFVYISYLTEIRKLSRKTSSDLSTYVWGTNEQPPQNWVGRWDWMILHQKDLESPHTKLFPFTFFAENQFSAEMSHLENFAYFFDVKPHFFDNFWQTIRNWIIIFHG